VDNLLITPYNPLQPISKIRAMWIMYNYVDNFSAQPSIRLDGYMSGRLYGYTSGSLDGHDPNLG